MELQVTRKIKTDESTIGYFTVNGEFFSYSLEPINRGLNSNMELHEIHKIKIPHKTAIPTGRYQLAKYFSPKHNAFVPLLLHVPGFDFVEIHVGNYAKDTDGCTLLGNQKDDNFIGDSKTAVNKFYGLFFAALKRGEQVWITYI